MAFHVTPSPDMSLVSHGVYMRFLHEISRTMIPIIPDSLTLFWRALAQRAPKQGLMAVSRLWARMMELMVLGRLSCFLRALCSGLLGLRVTTTFVIT